MSSRPALHLVVRCLMIGLVVSCTLSWTRTARAEPIDACAAACAGVAAVLDTPALDEVDPSFDETREVAECHAQWLGGAFMAVFSGFVARERAGAVVDAVPLPAVLSPPGSPMVWTVKLHAPGFWPMSAEVDDHWAYRLSKFTPASTVPCIAVGDRLEQLGERPAVQWWRLSVGFMLAMALAVLGTRGRPSLAGKKADELSAEFTRLRSPRPR